jgi:hypothetical protein
VVYSSNELSKSNQLTCVSHSDTEYMRSTPVTMDIKHVLTVLPIYHLQLIEEKTVVGELIEVMDLLREVKTLKISCLSIYYGRDNWEEKYDLLSSLKSTSKITKVCLVNIDMIEEFDCLMELCPYMEYFKVECRNSMNFEYLLRHVLNKINNERNQHLRLLCFNAPAADEEMIKRGSVRTPNIATGENFFFSILIPQLERAFNFSLKFQFSRFSTQWKSF